MKCPVITPNFSNWIDKYGVDFSMEVYIKNGFKMPDLSTYETTHNQDIIVGELGTKISEYLPKEFEHKNLSEILHTLPSEAKAAFLKNVLYFSDSPSSAEVMEEIMHAVFQRLLSPSEKSVLLTGAKNLLKAKGISEESYYQELLEKYPATYQEMSKEEGIARMYEEVLAQDFIRYFQNSAAVEASLPNELSFVGKLAQVLAEAILKIFRFLKSLIDNTNANRTELEYFYDKILKGNFKNSEIVSEGSTVPATALIKYKGRDKDGDFFQTNLTDQESNQLILTLSQAVLDIKDSYLREGELIKTKDLLELTLESVRDFYKSSTLPNKSIYVSALTPNTPYSDVEQIKKDILTYINSISNQNIDYLEVMQGEEGDADLQGSDTIAANEKGFDAMSSYLKAFISTIGIAIPNAKIDTKLLDSNGQPIKVELKQMADPNVIYYGLARSMANTTSEWDRLKKLKDFAHIPSNKFANALWKKIVSHSTGVSMTDSTFPDVLNSFNNSLETQYAIYLNTGNPTTINSIHNLKPEKNFLLQSVLNGFDLWTRDNWYAKIDSDKGELLQAGNANSNLASDYLLNQWKDFFYSTPRTELPELSVLLNDFSKNAIVKDSSIPAIAKSLHTTLTSVLGDLDINVVEGIVYTIYEKPFPQHLELYKKLVNFNLIDRNDVENILLGLRKQFTIFDEKEGILNRLKTLANVFSTTDENIVESTYKNAENKTIYTYQQKTFQLLMFNEFLTNISNLKTYLDNIEKDQVLEYKPNKYLKQASAYLKGHYYLKKYKELGNDFLRMITEGKFYSVDGVVNEQTKASITFSGMTTHDFDIYQLQLRLKQSPTVVNGITYRPVLINLMEAKRTASFMEMPVITNLVKNGLFTDKAFTLLTEEIDREYKRIRRVGEEMQELVNFIKVHSPSAIDRKEDKVQIEITPKLIEELQLKGLALDWIHDYYPNVIQLSTDTKDVVLSFDGRGSKFTDYTKGLIPAESFELYRKNAMNLASPMKDLSLDVYLKSKLQSEFLKYSDEVIAHFIKNKYLKLIPSNIRENNDELKQVLLSDYLNTLYLNQLLQSDPALVVKTDGVDFFKRAGGQNAAIVSLKTGFTNSELGITSANEKFNFVVGTEPKGMVSMFAKGEEEVNIADGQSYFTVQAYRKYLHGVSKLTPAIANLLDTIEKGLPLTEEQIEIVHADNYLNVLKPVAYNGYFYFKTGTVLLTKDFTSIINPEIALRYNSYQEAVEKNWNNKEAWIPKKGSEFLHAIRVEMEAKNIDMFMPKTASKMLNINLLETNNFSRSKFPNIDRNILQMDLDYFGSQMENPAGKEKIIDPSQMLEILQNELFGLSNAVELISKFQENLYTRTTVNFQKALSELTDEQFKIKWTSFLERARETIVNSGGDVQTIELFTLSPEGKREYNLNMSITKEKFVNILFSQFSSEVVQHKVSGDACALVSPVNFKLMKKIVRFPKAGGGFVYSWETIPTKSQEYLQNFEGAAMFTENKDSEDIIYDETDVYHQLNGTKKDQLISQLEVWYNQGNLYFFDELRHMKPKWELNEKGEVNSNNIKYFTEMVMPKNKKGYGITKNTKYMFGVRIPSQDRHSAVNIEWVDEIPEYYGNTVLIAKEIIYLSGSDFDIDKLFITKPELYEDEEGEFVPYSENNYEQWLEYELAYNKDLYKEYKSLLEKSPEWNNLKQELKKHRASFPYDWENYSAIIEDNKKEIDRLKAIQKKHAALFENIKLSIEEKQKIKNQVLRATPSEETVKQAVKEVEDMTNLIVKTEASIKREKREGKDVSNANALLNMLKYEREVKYRNLVKADVSDLQLEIEEDFELKNKKRTYLKGISTQLSSIFKSIEERNEFFEKLRTLKENAEIIKGLALEKALRNKKMPTNEAEYKASPIPVVGKVNNDLLELRHKMLLNEITLKDTTIDASQLEIYKADLEKLYKQIDKFTNEDGTVKPKVATAYQETVEAIDMLNSKINNFKTGVVKAPAKTPATQTLLTTTIENYKIMKDGQLIYLFTSDGQAPNNSNKLFNIESKDSVHSFLGHSNAHKNVKTGQNNIGIAVSLNLLAIALQRLNVSVNNSAKIELDGRLFNYFPTMNEDGERIFDAISSFISAATDEAKDRQNAKYGLTPVALNIGLPLVMLGMSPAKVIAILQQPVIKRFLELSSQKEYIIQSETDANSVRLNARGLLSKIRREFKLEQANTSLDSSMLWKGIHEDFNPVIQSSILNLVSKTLDIGQELQPLMSLVRLKKGFGKDLESFDKLVEDINVLYNKEISKYVKTNLYSRLRKLTDEDSPLVQEYKGYVNLVSSLKTVLANNVLDYLDSVRRVKNPLLNQVKPYLSNDNKKKIDEAITTFIYTTLYRKYSGSEKTYMLDDSLASTVEAWKSFVKEVNENPELNEIFKGNSFINKLKIAKSRDRETLQLATFSKVSSAAQMALIDGFSDLFYKSFSNPIVEKYKELPHQLFHYFVAKDGWLFKGGSLSKGIPSYFFKPHSRSLDIALENKQRFIESREFPFYEYNFAKKVALNKELSTLLPSINDFNFPEDYGTLEQNGFSITINNNEELEETTEAFAAAGMSNFLAMLPFGEVALNPIYFVNRKETFIENNEEVVEDVLYYLDRVKTYEGIEIPIESYLQDYDTVVSLYYERYIPDPENGKPEITSSEKNVMVESFEIPALTESPMTTFISRTQASDFKEPEFIKISTPIASKKKIQYTLYNGNLKKEVTKSGYKVTVPEFPNIEMYVTNEDIVEGEAVKTKLWNLEIFTEGIGVRQMPSVVNFTIKAVLEEFADEINNIHSKSKSAREQLKEIGMDLEIKTESSEKEDEDTTPCDDLPF